MHIESAKIKGYRLFDKEVSISLHPKQTIIVGRNNSGKTSFVEIFYKFLGVEKTGRFTVDDFSRRQRANLEKAATLWQQAQKNENKDRDELEKQARNNLPEISLEIEFKYEDKDNLTPLSNLILDLDEKRHDAMMRCQFAIKDDDKKSEFLTEFHKSKYAKKKDGIIEFTRRRMRYFSTNFIAVDKENPDTVKELDPSDVKKAISCDFIYAQTMFDDTALDTGHGLSKGFEKYYQAIADTDETLDRLEDAIQSVSKNLDDEYKSLFESVIAQLTDFGAGKIPGLDGIKVVSKFNPTSLIKGNTKVTYDDKGSSLPESHNGLGYTKLIYIVLQLSAFFESYRQRQPQPGTQLIFIEEPEAHLHPQMQSVFIKNIGKYLDEKREQDRWNVQLIVTTHSSHIIADSGFEGLRYFDVNEGNLSVKDLDSFIKNEENSVSVEFLAQYMQLRKCDMFFADKIILIEGTTERLLLPKMIEKEASGLLHDYISIIEVGGAYAIKFRELLHFLHVPTLIITDIDSINPAENNKKIETSFDNAVTSNVTLKEWIPGEKDIKKLLAPDVNKGEEFIQVAYQIAEHSSMPVGRSFEEAFILANASVLTRAAKKKDPKFVNRKYFCENGTAYPQQRICQESYEIASRISHKTDFAFDILMLDDWKTPVYIKEGLKWLASVSK